MADTADEHNEAVDAIDYMMMQLASYHANQQMLSEKRMQFLSGEAYQREVLRETERYNIANTIVDKYDALVAMRQQLELFNNTLFPTDENVGDESN